MAGATPHRAEYPTRKVRAADVSILFVGNSLTLSHDPPNPAGLAAFPYPEVSAADRAFLAEAAAKAAPVP